MCSYLMWGGNNAMETYGHALAWSGDHRQAGSARHCCDSLRHGDTSPKEMRGQIRNRE